MAPHTTFPTDDATPTRRIRLFLTFFLAASATAAVLPFARAQFYLNIYPPLKPFTKPAVANITIAVLNPYFLSFVVPLPVAYGLPGEAKAMDAAAQLAFDDVNSDMSVFPDANFVIKRVDSYSLELQKFGSNWPDSANYAAINLYNLIKADPTGPNASIPGFPLALEISSRFQRATPPIHYPYQFQPAPSMHSAARAWALLLQSLNVRRVAILIGRDYTQDLDIITTELSAAGVKTAGVVVASIVPTLDDYNVWAATLKASDARYIIAHGDADVAWSTTTFINATGLYGPKFVWIFRSQPSRDLFALRNVSSTADPYYKDFKTKYLNGAKNFPDWFHTNNGSLTVEMARSYDCIHLMVRGFYEMKKKLNMSTLDFAAGKLDKYMTADAFSVPGSSVFPSDGSLDVTLLVNSASSGTGLTILVLGAVGVLLALCCLATIVANRKEKIVIQGSVLFMSLIAVGCAVAVASAVVMVGTPTSLSCNLRLWMQLTGFALTVGSVLFKSGRLYVIFSGSLRIPKSWVKDLGGAMLVLVILVVEWALLAGWTAVQNPQPTVKQDATTIMTVCQSQSGKAYPGHILLYAYNAALLGASLYVSRLALMSDRAHLDYATDTAASLSALAVAAFFAVAILPLVASTAPSPATDATRFMVVWLVCVLALLSIFAPKLLSLAVQMHEQRISKFTSANTQTASKTAAPAPNGNETGSGLKGIVCYRTHTSSGWSSWVLARLAMNQFFGKVWLTLDSRSDSTAFPLSAASDSAASAATAVDVVATGCLVRLKVATRPAAAASAVAPHSSATAAGGGVAPAAWLQFELPSPDAAAALAQKLKSPSPPATSPVAMAVRPSVE
ncbi:periplasmic binding protein-like I [Zopfochytrium polystomum]|nr:periplasmic binding protein-like I [Zopfochytrium polystomum]